MLLMIQMKFEVNWWVPRLTLRLRNYIILVLLGQLQYVETPVPYGKWGYADDVTFWDIGDFIILQLATIHKTNYLIIAFSMFSSWT